MTQRVNQPTAGSASHTAPTSGNGDRTADDLPATVVGMAQIDRADVAVATLVPPVSALPDVFPDERFNERGVPARPWRDELRRIPNARNVGAVVSTLAQSFGVVIVAGILNTWWAYVIAFFLMARGHVCLNILAHESAHRLLFSKRWANDFCGRWLLGYPSFQPTLAYRRSHFAHHRDEMGPDEPDLAMYAGYPIPAASWHRKLRRDLIGITGYKRMKQLARALSRRGVEAWEILGVQVVMLAASIAVGRPLVYVVWLASWMTLWQFSNRLRAIAEHGGMIRSRDRRETDPRDPSDPRRPLSDGAVSHGLAPRPPRRHGRPLAQSAEAARRSRRRRLDHAGDHVPELSGLLALGHPLTPRHRPPHVTSRHVTGSATAFDSRRAPAKMPFAMSEVSSARRAR